MKSTYLRDVVVPSLTFFFLELNGNATNGSALDALHKMSHETGDLVSKTLARDDGDLLAYSLVGVKVESQSSVVLLDDHSRRLLDGLGTNATLKAPRRLISRLGSM